VQQINLMVVVCISGQVSYHPRSWKAPVCFRTVISRRFAMCTEGLRSEGQANHGHFIMKWAQVANMAEW